jgi:membrane fusion protein, heavy metal efflux system
MHDPLRRAFLAAFQIAMLTVAARVEIAASAGQALVVALDEKQIREAGIETQPVEPSSGFGELVAPGVVVAPPQQVRMVATPAAGLLEMLLVAVDQEVKEGDTIARLRSSDLVEAQRAFLQADADASLAAVKLQRDELLFKEGIIAERRLLTTRAEAIHARAALQERTAFLTLLGMSGSEVVTLRKDRQMASTLLVRAPMSGAIIARHGAVGERVAAATPLFTVARLDPIWVNLQIPASRAAAVVDQAPVTLAVNGLKGRVIRIGRTVDSSTQSITAVAEFATGKTIVRPGQAVQAILSIPIEGDRQWRVPAAAIVHYEEKHWVFLRTQTGFRLLPVTLVAETAQFVSVRGPLKESDRVVARGVLALIAELAEPQK